MSKIYFGRCKRFKENKNQTVLQTNNGITMISAPCSVSNIKKTDSLRRKVLSMHFSVAFHWTPSSNKPVLGDTLFSFVYDYGYRKF